MEYCWIDDGADPEPDPDDESMYIPIRVCSWNDLRLPTMTWWSLIGSEDESLVFGEVDEFLSLFFIVEFQKFFISLSVLPGKRAAIWDHLIEKNQREGYTILIRDILSLLKNKVILNLCTRIKHYEDNFFELNYPLYRE